MLQKQERFVAEFKLFDIVKLKAEVAQAGSSPWGGVVTAGSVGAIVEDLRDGFFLVEFGAESSEPTILTLPAHSLALEWSSPE